jgi:hypothetical protein
MDALLLSQLLEKTLKEAKEFKEKGDIQQSCEKLYSVVESLIKVLAEKENVEAYRKAKESGGWNSYLLGEAAAELDKKYSKDEILIWLVWVTAHILHRECFYDNCISPKEFEMDFKLITEKLPVVARKTGIELKFESNTEK